MPTGPVQAAKDRETRLASIVVLNEQVAELRKDVGDMKAKLDEALLIGTGVAASFKLIAGSIQMAAKALVAMTAVLVFFSASHSVFLEWAFHAAKEWFIHAVL
jgi:hypothetical protein